MLSTNELHLLEPLDATAPQAEHLFHELRRLSCEMAVGWAVRPLAHGDENHLRRIYLGIQKPFHAPLVLL